MVTTKPSGRGEKAVELATDGVLQRVAQQVEESLKEHLESSLWGEIRAEARVVVYEAGHRGMEADRLVELVAVRLASKLKIDCAAMVRTTLQGIVADEIAFARIRWVNADDRGKVRPEMFSRPASWADVGAAAGMSAQGACKQFRDLPLSSEPGFASERNRLLYDEIPYIEGLSERVEVAWNGAPWEGSL